MTVMAKARSVRRSAVVCTSVLGLWGLAALATAESKVSFAAHDVKTTFFITKSENRNQVHYGVRTDAACVPRGDSPVFAYWQDLEDGPNATSPILDHEQRAYGIETQSVISRTTSGGSISLQHRALKGRPMRVDVSKDASGACVATTLTRIDGKRAKLDRAHLEIGFLQLKKLTLYGHALKDGKAVEESLKP
ncbi:MAG: DUF4833 domain-containing protein [Myxococcales bacterium]|nr:DUF4833 domain-containing protein [Myxococcales bacterium]